MDSLACSLDSKTSEIQPRPSGFIIIIIIYPGHQQFFVTKNPTPSESPSSVSRKNNCVKKEINRGKLIYV